MKFMISKNPFYTNAVVLICVGLLPLNLYSDSSSKSSFMGSSLINMPSTENVGKENLDFRFNHRFGNAKGTSESFIGLDGGANTQLSIDYGFTEKFSVGFARTSQYKTYELRSKYGVFSQDEKIPFSISIFGVIGQETSKQEIAMGPYIQPPSTSFPALDAYIKKEANEYELSDTDKRSFLASVLISRRFNDVFSLQFSPMIVHRNFVKTELSNDRIGMDIAGRIKLSKRIDLTFESILTPKRDYIGEEYNSIDRNSYGNTQNLTSEEINKSYPTSNDLLYVYFRNVVYDKPVPYSYIPFSIGVDFETGGHVFQLFVTNSRTIAHTQLLRGADFDYKNKDWTIGFNIHRYFSFEDEISKEN